MLSDKILFKFVFHMETGLKVECKWRNDTHLPLCSFTLADTPPHPITLKLMSLFRHIVGRKKNSLCFTISYMDDDVMKNKKTQMPTSVHTLISRRYKELMSIYVLHLCIIMQQSGAANFCGTATTLASVKIPLGQFPRLIDMDPVLFQVYSCSSSAMGLTYFTGIGFLVA